MENTSLLSSLLVGSDPSCSVCCISRDGVDKLRVIGFTQNLLDSFRSALLATWQKGIQTERVYGSAYELKFRGFPWKHTHQKSTNSGRLVIGIMQFMLAKGWALELEMTASNQHRANMNSWFFRKQMQGKHIDMCGVSFKWGDMIRIIDGPEVSDVVLLAIKNHWHRGLQSDNYYKQNSDFLQEFKLKGFPWRSTGKEKIETNAFVMRMMDALKSAGWVMYAPIDSCSIYRESEMNYWVFQKVDPLLEVESDSTIM